MSGLSKFFIGTVALLLITLHLHGESTRVLKFPQLKKEVKVIYDTFGIPHIYAKRKRDLFFAKGYIEAQNRFFQMDTLRHTYHGTSAELVGSSGLGNDFFYRTLLWDRWAQQSMNVTPRDRLRDIQAYADGINAFIHNPDNPLPAEYAALNLTRSSIKPWTVKDTFVLYAGFTSDFILSDYDLLATQAIQAAEAVLSPTNANNLWFDDLHPAFVLPTPTLHGFFKKIDAIAENCNTCKSNKSSSAKGANNTPNSLKRTASRFSVPQDKIKAALQFIQPRTAGGSKFERGTNLFMVSGKHSASGQTLLCNDPHVVATTPNIFYEVHTILDNDPQPSTIDIMGFGIPGLPGVFMSRGKRTAFGASVDLADTTDFWFEQLVLGNNSQPIATIFDGKQEPLTTINQQFFVNNIQPNVVNNIQFATSFDVFLTQRDRILYPPTVSGNSAISFRSTLFGPIQDLEGLAILAEAKHIAEVKEAVRKINGFTLNIFWGDDDGNIAFYTTGARPIRADLQILGHPDGVGPNQVRDGSNPLHDWLPVINPQPDQVARFEVLPQDEMPFSINPEKGFLVNCNNIPINAIVNNDPYAKKRPCGGVYYYGYYAGIGVRNTILTELIERAIRNGHKITFDDMRRFDHNDQSFFAEFQVPFIIAALQHAQAPGAWPPLAALASDPEVINVVNRFKAWGEHADRLLNFSTPVGIPVVYNFNKPNEITYPTEAEVKNSIAQTLFDIWWQRFAINTFFDHLNALGISGAIPTDVFQIYDTYFLLKNFAKQHGIGVSGVNFVAVPGSPSQQASLDFLILKSIQDALALLRSPAFSPPFSATASLDDFQWGKLHQLVIPSAVGGNFNVPPAGGTSVLAGVLGGIPTPGSITVNPGYTASPVIATSASDYIAGVPLDFSGYRIVREVKKDIFSKAAVAGGQSGNTNSPFFADQLKFWLKGHLRPEYYKKCEVLEHATSQIVMVPKK